MRSRVRSDVFRCALFTPAFEFESGSGGALGRLGAALTAATAVFIGGGTFGGGLIGAGRTFGRYFARIRRLLTVGCEVGRDERSAVCRIMGRGRRGENGSNLYSEYRAERLANVKIAKYFW